MIEKAFTLHGNGIGKNGSRMPGARGRKLPGSKHPVGPNGPVAAGIYRSISASEMAKDIREEMLSHAKMDHNRHPDWEKIEPGSKVMITINNSKSRLHGKVILVERLKNGLFRVINSMNKSFGPILIDIKNPVREKVVLNQQKIVTEQEKKSLLLKKLGMSQEKEYDEHGRPTLFLMALRSVGAVNKHDALQKSKKFLEK